MKDHLQFYLPHQEDITKPLNNDFVSSPNILRLDKNLNIKDRYIFNDKEFINRAGQSIGRTIFSTLITGSVYTASVSDYLIGITSLSYSPSIGLPRPKDVGAGKTYIVKDEVGGASTTTITIRSVGEETIDGASSATITGNYVSKSFYTDGANWFIY